MTAIQFTRQKESYAGRIALGEVFILGKKFLRLIKGFAVYDSGIGLVAKPAAERERTRVPLVDKPLVKVTP
ncbi:hypothetical protein FACS1894211_04140 [Clostridia bacterium]|nr:hypothetical protein FACS1894211_04140 [Clostridia bacterium]